MRKHFKFQSDFYLVTFPPTIQSLDTTLIGFISIYFLEQKDSSELRQIYGNDSEEGQRQRMIVGIGGRGIVYNGALKNKVVREEAESKNHIVFIRETDIKNLYRHRADVGFQ